MMGVRPFRVNAIVSVVGAAHDGHDGFLEVRAGGVERVDFAGQRQVQFQQPGSVAVVGRADEIESGEFRRLILGGVEEAVEFAALMARAGFADERAAVFEDAFHRGAGAEVFLKPSRSFGLHGGGGAGLAVG
jgi:hypothetical protein